jgi:hypothetical protein
MARARVGGETVWLTAAELADRLKVAQSTLWQWNLRNYGPPATRIGGKLRYRLKGRRAVGGRAGEPGPCPVTTKAAPRGGHPPTPTSVEPP